MFIARSTVVLAAAAWAVPALADDLLVPSQYPTIQAAVSASQAGDVIILADGVYQGAENYNIVMPGHAISVRSASGNPEACEIRMPEEPDQTTAARAFHFTHESSSDIVVRDIKLARGSAGSRVFIATVGGAVLIEGSSPTFTNCIFERNSPYDECSSTFGSAVYLVDSNATFDRCVFDFNSAGVESCLGFSAGKGGGVYVDRGAPQFIDCSFVRNDVDGSFGASGGAMYIADGNVLISGTRFDRNRTFGSAYGGAIAVAGGEVVAIDCEFTGNYAYGTVGEGGAISVTGGSLALVNNILVDNWVESDDLRAMGGAMYVQDAEVFIANCLIAQNSSSYEFSFCDPSRGEGSFGGALFLTGSASVTIRSTTLADNFLGGSMPCGGEAIFLWGGGAPTLDIANSIVWGSGERPIETWGAGASITAEFCILKGSWPGEQILDRDPMFVDAAAGDYRLLPGSPAADAGANDLVPPDTYDLDGDGDITEPLPLDLAWNPRFTDDPAAPDTGRGTAPIVDMGAYETVVDFCYADCDGSGELDFFDFLCFQSAFAAGEPYADCDGSGSFNFFDFLCFQNAFAAGCP